ncbi:hypothetical protein BAE44_0005314 [Dichanthelium oligosanthes]|uniref:Uncharacterized protein n=1 Tax=Dichanthelium oligosanthes TaxID=888268 RepID=A0A1E5W8C6_9POAL|nr:hypothetical protein BAE44_0005314 [Dichanthelium oligosanthes]
MRRRFVHLVATSFINLRRAYRLHLIHPSMFFYPTKPSSGSAGGGTVMEEFQLPPAAMTFYGPSQECHLSAMDFMPLGQGCKKGIIGSLPHHPLRRRLTCRQHHARGARTQEPAHLRPRRRQRLRAAEEPDAGGPPLLRGPHPRPRPRVRCCPDWYWHPLPSPPHAHANNYVFTEDDCSSDDVDGHTLVAGSHIWVSTERVGTYSFSTVAGTWSKVGNWAMPFGGRAEYVPKRNLWLGFSSQDNRLCASDLVATSPLQPPKLLGKWEDVVQKSGSR